MGPGYTRGRAGRGDAGTRGRAGRSTLRPYDVTLNVFAMITSSLVLIGVGVVLLVAAVVCAVLGWRRESGVLAIQDARTLTTAEVAERHRYATHGAARFGEPVEICGVIECDTPLRAPYSETVCVAFDFTHIEEREQHVRGRGMRRGYEIETYGRDNHSRRAPRFWVNDGRGRVAVDPAGASLDMLETVARYESYTGIGDNEREIWRQEWALPVGQRVYLLGYLLDDQGQPLIGRHPLDQGRPFLISHRDEAAFARSLRGRSYLFYLAGGLSGGLAVALMAVALLI